MLGNEELVLIRGGELSARGKGNPQGGNVGPERERGRALRLGPAFGRQILDQSHPGRGDRGSQNAGRGYLRC